MKRDSSFAAACLPRKVIKRGEYFEAHLMASSHLGRLQHKSQHTRRYISTIKPYNLAARAAHMRFATLWSVLLIYKAYNSYSYCDVRFEE